MCVTAMSNQMKRVPIGLLVAAIAISLLAGGIAGFFFGVASTKAGANFLKHLVERERQAETGNPQKLAREEFELLYPANWKINVDDKDYDPDRMFTIDSPGSAFVMFVLGKMETNPDDSLQAQIDSFSRLMGTPQVQRFESYGKLHGKGATLRGKLMGIKVTVKAFACSSQGMTAVVVQQYPDEDLRYVQGGLLLIEESFTLQPGKQGRAPDKPDARDGL